MSDAVKLAKMFIAAYEGIKTGDDSKIPEPEETLALARKIVAEATVRVWRRGGDNPSLYYTLVAGKVLMTGPCSVRSGWCESVDFNYSNFPSQSLDELTPEEATAILASRPLPPEVKNG